VDHSKRRPVPVKRVQGPGYGRRKKRRR
jgi:hypothetical protein